MIVDYDENHNLQKARYKFLKVYYNKTSNDRIVSYIKKMQRINQDCDVIWIPCSGDHSLATQNREDEYNNAQEYSC